MKLELHVDFSGKIKEEKTSACLSAE